jgi:hypothetical protein
MSIEWTEGKTIIDLEYKYYLRFYDRCLNYVAILAEQHDTRLT